MGIKLKHLVADAGGFIQGAQFRDIAENVYTIPEVVSEIRDKATRQRLKVTPLELTYREPSSDALSAVTLFAKKTGDYGFLSHVDLKVLALTYDLEKEYNGTDKIRLHPPTKPSNNLSKNCNISEQNVSANVKILSEGEPLPTSLIDNFESDNLSDEAEEDASIIEELDSVKLSEEVYDDEAGEDGEDDDDEEDEEDDEDDDEGWITPENIADVKRSMGVETTKTPENVNVGCLTTDFAMQNVLIQMGLKVISVDGLHITRARSYILRCFGCFRITKDTSRKFCFHCGHRTLRKLTTSIDEDGIVHYHMAKKYIVINRGKRMPLFKPQGGKHAMNQYLVEDQPFPQQRPSKKALQKFDIMSEDIVSSSSPFKSRDITSRSAQLGITQWNKRCSSSSHKSNRKKK